MSISLGPKKAAMRKSAKSTEGILATSPPCCGAETAAFRWLSMSSSSVSGRRVAFAAAAAAGVSEQVTEKAQSRCEAKPEVTGTVDSCHSKESIVAIFEA